MDKPKRSPLSLIKIRDKVSNMAHNILKINSQRGNSVKSFISGRYALILAVTMIFGIHFLVKLSLRPISGRWENNDEYREAQKATISERFRGLQGEQVLSAGSMEFRDEKINLDVKEENASADYKTYKFSSGEAIINMEVLEAENNLEVKEISEASLHHVEEEYEDKQNQNRQNSRDASHILFGDRQIPIKRIILEDSFQTDFEHLKPSTGITSSLPESSTVNKTDDQFQAKTPKLKAKDPHDAILVDSKKPSNLLPRLSNGLTDEESQAIAQATVESPLVPPPHRNKVPLDPKQVWSHRIPEPTDDELEKWKAFRLGPRVDDWDEQRAQHIAEHPGSNVSRLGQPRVMLVTASDPAPCKNSAGDHLLMKLAKNKMDYARLKDMQLYWSHGNLRDDFDIYWSKYPLLRSLMLQHPYIEWFWWIDADAMITDMEFNIPWRKYDNYTLVLNGWDYLVHQQREWTGVNAGVFLIRNCMSGLDLLDEWASYGPKGDVRWFWGPTFTNGLHGRPDNFDSDDQAAILWTMIHKKDTFGRQIFVESTYNLHSYWIWIVDKYEEMARKNHPGLGDDRWPLVTHFVGCKLCGSGASYDMKNCETGILRAYNFADNQVVKLYGYKHPSLTSTRLVPLHNASAQGGPGRGARKAQVG